MKRILPLIIPLLLHSSCAFVGRNLDAVFGSKAEEPVEAESTRATSTEPEGGQSSALEPNTEVVSVPVEPLTPPTSGVEIVWQVPTTPADGYVVRYGFNQENLDQEVKLPTSDIVRVKDTEHGEVYRYVIRSLPSDKSIYVSLAAIQGDIISEPTKVFEVKPEEPKTKEPEAATNQTPAS